jgi:DNA-binding transcriptional regulator YiaG
MELKDIIRKLRGKESRKAFADRLNVTRQAVYDWELGKNLPRQQVLDQLNIRADYKVQREVQ